MITEDILLDWSYSGKSRYDSNTYNRLSKVISDNFQTEEIFLQGSYANSTCIHESSDVDIVVVCKGYYMESYKSESELKYLRTDLYNEIEGACNFHFKLDKKTIKYQGSLKYSQTDILPCIYYRSRYGPTGIAFYDYSENRYVVNYPKQHKENGIEKNKRTNDSYKRTVRIFKNLRDELIYEKMIGSKTAPSYFLECLLYNVPDYCFNDYAPNSFYNVLDWLLSNQWSFINMKCQNGIHYLFNDFNGWNLKDCRKFIFESGELMTLR